MTKYLTPEGLEKLKKELDYLENVKRKEIAGKLNYAISFGDLRENAAYHQAREEQSFLEGRILKLKEVLSRAKVIKKDNTGVVKIGSTVLVSSNGSTEKFVIVGPEETDIINGRISYKSPLGEMLLGKTKGNKVNINAPAGKTEYEIFEVR